eukprot:3219233-Pyramimonas_sp.AAC.1
MSDEGVISRYMVLLILLIFIISGGLLRAGHRWGYLGTFGSQVRARFEVLRNKLIGVFWPRAKLAASETVRASGSPREAKVRPKATRRPT